MHDHFTYSHLSLYLLLLLLLLQYSYFLNYSAKIRSFQYQKHGLLAPTLFWADFRHKLGVVVFFYHRMIITEIGPSRELKLRVRLPLSCKPISPKNNTIRAKNYLCIFPFENVNGES